MLLYLFFFAVILPGRIVTAIRGSSDNFPVCDTTDLAIAIGGTIYIVWAYLATVVLKLFQ